MLVRQFQLQKIPPGSLRESFMRCGSDEIGQQGAGCVSLYFYKTYLVARRARVDPLRFDREMDAKRLQCLGCSVQEMDLLPSSHQAYIYSRYLRLGMYDA